MLANIGRRGDPIGPRAFTLMLELTMKVVVFESYPEINGIVEKLVISFDEQFFLIIINSIIFIDMVLVIA